ncbi:MAG: penicillin-binding protein, partial [Gemmatimonadaceae bacterium]|nr:penicillin-binding protein [Chitinophagaceae bacterium]
YDPVLFAGIIGFMAGVIAISVKLFLIQVADSKEYLVKPARVINRNGLPLYSYNPRIEKLTRLLGAGTIYDRNKRILATSNVEQIKSNEDSLKNAGVDMLQLRQLFYKKHERYYPFGADLFFWTGDYNTRLFWGQANGFYAEARYLTALRGFATNPQKEDYIGTSYRPDRFTKPVEKPQTLVSYDYSPLADALQSGIDSTNPRIVKMKAMNRDVRLTVDASLQKEIQDSLRLSAFADKRMSVIVIDAAKGDVMASAVYPLPNLKDPEKMLLTEKEKSRLPMPVTDRDLGMSYATAPGSTAKILTAIAALNKEGMEAADKKYNDIYRTEIFRDNAKEQEPFVPKVRYVDMQEAIINSSNIYFIRVANEFNLENELGDLYQATGMNISHRGGYYYEPSADRLKVSKDLEAWREDVFTMDRRLYNNPENYGIKKRYRSDFSGLAWGQSKLTSTPIAMARMAGAIANKGRMQLSRYVMEETGTAKAPGEAVTIAKDTAYAGLLRKYMISQSSQPGKQKIKGMDVAGKTGTPERIVKGEKQSDGWYVFFAPTPDNLSHTVCCIRIEEGQSSANAVIIANTVSKILKKRGYIVSF